MSSKLPDTVPAHLLAHPSAPPSHERLKFSRSNGFRLELQRRVEAFFAETGRSPRDCPQMYIKTAILVSAYVAIYLLLVFFATNAWQAVPLAALLGLATAGIGFDIQHDAGHHAYSSRPWINRIMATTLDLIGGSSYVWRWKHGVFHHTYVNVAEHDADIDVGILARLSPHQKRYAFHRWQHFYLWPLYGFLAILWHFQSDFYEVAVGRIGKNRFPRPRGWDLIVFLAGKAFFFSFAFVVPLQFHSLGTVLCYYAIASVTLGIAAEHRVPVGTRGRSSKVPAADTRWLTHRKRMGGASGGDDRQLRTAQPHRILVSRRTQLSDRAPPFPSHLPHPLPGYVGRRRRRLPRIRSPLYLAHDLLGRPEIALPLAAHAQPGLKLRRRRELLPQRLAERTSPLEFDPHAASEKNGECTWARKTTRSHFKAESYRTKRDGLACFGSHLPSH
ncbi:MAG: fatty acid desaturase [Gemmataceae bacterium]